MVACESTLLHFDRHLVDLAGEGVVELLWSLDTLLFVGEKMYQEKFCVAMRIQCWLDHSHKNVAFKR